MSKHLKETDRLSERLKKIVKSFPKVTVTVLGDLVADEFIFGEISRVSREAPVLILKHRERSVVPGGTSITPNGSKRVARPHASAAAGSASQSDSAKSCASR